jgi:hypothetical protein
VFGVGDDQGGGGPGTIAVAENGIIKAAAAGVVNFVPVGGVQIAVTELPPGVANVRVAHPGGPGVFGSDYQAAASEEELTTNTAAWETVLELPFLALGGLYRLAWSTEVDSNGTYIGIRLRQQSGGVGPFTEWMKGEITAGALHDPHGGIVPGLFLDPEEQVFQFQIQSGGPPTSVGARRTRIDLWRVSDI